MGLSREMEEAVRQLNNFGHYTCVIENCYDNLGKIKILLSDKPDVIFSQTTFTYHKRLEELFSVASILKGTPKKKIQVWISSYKSERIFTYLPEKLLKYFEFYDFNHLHMETDGVEGCKTLIEP